MNYTERLFRQSVGFECGTTAFLIASLAISAAASTAQIQGQQASAKAQEIEEQQLVQANNKVVDAQASTLRQQQAQEAESRAREDFKADQATLKAASTASVAAGEAGVGGNSVNALLNEYNMQLGQFREATARQGQLVDTGITSQLESLKLGAGYQNLQIASPVDQPQYGVAALNLASSGIGAYRAYNPTAFARKIK